MSEIHNQLVATHEQLDLDEAQERVQRILHGQAGPTLTPVPQTQPQAPATRKKRSDAGLPKKPPADPDEITLRMTIDEARDLALGMTSAHWPVAARIQDQIIGHLQKRIDALQKGK